MSVTLTAVNSNGEVNISNGEWEAICAMGKVFGIKGCDWNGMHDQAPAYTPEMLKEMAMRAKQIGRAESWLLELANDGGATLS